MTTRGNYILQLAYDPRQLSNSLQYSLMPERGSPPDPEQKSGINAGTFNLSQGDRVIIEVVAVIDKGYDASDLEIYDLAMVYVPDLTGIPLNQIGNINQSLSMFDPDSAVLNISAKNNGNYPWTKPVSVENDPAFNGAETLTSRSLNTYTVTAESGAWEISGYLSVILNLTNSATGASQLIKRLYCFDPEGSAGAGTGGGVGP